MLKIIQRNTERNLIEAIVKNKYIRVSEHFLKAKLIVCECGIHDIFILKCLLLNLLCTKTYNFIINMVSNKDIPIRTIYHT